MLRPSPVVVRDEYNKARDMKEHARRLTRFHNATISKVWREQANGEYWLVDVYDGETGRPSIPEAA